MLLVQSNTLFRPGIMADTARTAAVGHVIVIDDRCIVYDRFIHVGVVNNRPVHTHNSGVIGKLAAMPLAANEANAHIAKSVVHAAVVSHVGSPVTRMENVKPTRPTPVGWCPEGSLIWSRHP